MFTALERARKTDGREAGIVRGGRPRVSDASNEEMTRLQQQLEHAGEGAAPRRRRAVRPAGAAQEVSGPAHAGEESAAVRRGLERDRRHAQACEGARGLGAQEHDRGRGLQKQLDERSEGHAALQARYDEAHADWQHSLGDLRKEAERSAKPRPTQIEATHPRAAEAASSTRSTKQRQQHRPWRASSATPASACRTRVRPAVAQQLKRGELVHCEGCHRILYLERPTS